MFSSASLKVLACDRLMLPSSSRVRGWTQNLGEKSLSTLCLLSTVADYGGWLQACRSSLQERMVITAQPQTYTGQHLYTDTLEMFTFTQHVLMCANLPTTDLKIDDWGHVLFEMEMW